MAADWTFLVDENVSRAVQAELEARGYPVEHVVDALGPGVDDVPDVLPYARGNGHVVVTKDYSDFGRLDPSDHCGLVLVADHSHPPHVVGDAIEAIVSAYPSRDAFRSQSEFLDDW